MEHVPPKAILFGASLTLLVLLLTRGTWLTDAPDSLIYEDMAHGQTVARPFANRILHPLIVRGLAAGLHVSTDRAFLITDVAALFTFFTGVAWVLLHFARGPLAPAVFLVSPFALQLFRNGYLPDLPYAALLAVFFALLAGRKQAAAMAVLFLLVLARESTILLSAILVFVAYRRGERKLLLGAIGVTAVGLGVVACASRFAAGNTHAASTPLYLLLKIPFNVSKNVFGVVLWSNTLDGLKHFAPTATFELPPALRVGAIRSIGYAGFHAQFPLLTLAVLLTEFGVAPAILWAAWRRSRAVRPSQTEEPLWLSVAIGYGVASFLLGPALGAEVWRLVGYGWPAMLLAAPMFIVRMNRATAVIVFLQLATCWAGALVAPTEPPLWLLLAVILFAFFGQALALRALQLEPLEHRVRD